MSTSRLKKGDYILYGNYPQRRVYPYEDVYEKLNECYTGTETEYAGKKYAVVRKPNGKRWPLTKEYQRFRWLGLDYVFFEYRPILWRVLDVIDEKALLFSEYIIDCKNYNEKSGYCTWHESTLRSWLNGYSANENRNGIDYSKSGFFNKAFSEKEKVLIVNKEITIMSNEGGTQKVLSGYEREAVKRDYGITHYGFPKPDYNISKKILDDKIILLTAEELYNTEYGFKSIDEIEEFDAAKTAYPTEYAVANQANISIENEGNNLGSDWFVRSFLEEESFLSPPPWFCCK